jgi:hypothetical protein
MAPESRDTSGGPGGLLSLRGRDGSTGVSVAVPATRRNRKRRRMPSRRLARLTGKVGPGASGVECEERLARRGSPSVATWRGGARASELPRPLGLRAGESVPADVAERVLKERERLCGEVAASDSN